MSYSPPKWVFTRMQRTAAMNARQHAIIDVWEAWLAEGEGDLEVEGFTVPKLLDDLWALSVQYKKPQNKSSEECSSSLPCATCGGSGSIIEGEQGAQYQVACENCYEIKPLTGEMTPERDAEIRVTLRCPKCRSEQRCARHSSDPVNTAVIELTCPKCHRDGDFQLIDYFDADGNQIDCDGNLITQQKKPATKEPA